jgi:hypothetical protein
MCSLKDTSVIDQYHEVLEVASAFTVGEGDFFQLKE